MKKIILFSAILLFALSTSHYAYAGRKALMSPDLIEYKAESVFSSEYRSNLDKAKNSIDKYKDAALSDTLLKLYRTSRKKTAEIIIRDLTLKLQQFKDRDAKRIGELNKIVEEMRAEVNEKQFNNYRTGVDFEVDNKNREYIVAWDDDGKEIVKKQSFVPEMNLIVKGEYVAEKKDKRKVMVYRYLVENEKSSMGSTMEMYLENKFAQEYIRNKIKQKYGGMSVYSEIGNDVKLNVSYPDGNTNYFIFYVFDSKTEMLIKYNPGANTKYFYVLEEIENSVPGITNCFVPVVGFEMFSSDTEPPEIVADIFSTPPDKRTRYMYSGRTIGPVPIPEPFDKAKFIEQIIIYNNQSLAEGWIDKQTVIEYTKNELVKIKKKPDDKKLIRGFLDKIEGFYQKDMMLSEAYVLLKYNIEYLLSRLPK